ncbi:hypothetical protein MIR68_010397 [Amoeboaphelidium protococcarum]|nr:hypothetical protein MIR68_010397 [Amoeboaphelidium protococcarum]
MLVIMFSLYTNAMMILKLALLRNIDAVPTPAAGDDHQQVQEDGVQADLAVLNYIFDLYKDNDGEEVLVVLGHNRELKAIKQVEALAEVNDLDLEQLDLEGFQLMQRKSSCVSIVYKIPGSIVEFHGKKEITVDGGIRNYVAVCSPVEDVELKPC